MELRLISPSATLRALAALVATALAAGCASAPPATLPSRIDALTAAPALQHAIWGIEVEDDAGRVLYSRNAHLLMVPASNRKLFAAATILDCLGATAQLQTQLWMDGDDVIVRGDGDPSFGNFQHASAGFSPFVSALRAAGVRRVHDVVVDVSRFDRVTVPGSWKVGNLASDYSAPVDAIAWDENAIGDRAVSDPAAFAAGQFRDALVLGGIAVEGTTRVITDDLQLPHCAFAAPAPGGAGLCRLVSTIPSPYVGDLLATMLKLSDNLFAEMLFKRVSPEGSYEASEALERGFVVSEIGVVPDEFQFGDGSGLSPDDLVTPAAIVKALRWMNEPPRRGFWWSALAVPGEIGTLHRRIVDLAPRARGKTGTLNGVRALSLIIAGRHGGYRYVSVVLNHSLAATKDELTSMNGIAEAVADF